MKAKYLATTKNENMNQTINTNFSLLPINECFEIQKICAKHTTEYLLVKHQINSDKDKRMDLEEKPRIYYIFYCKHQ